MIRDTNFYYKAGSLNGSKEKENPSAVRFDELFAKGQPKLRKIAACLKRMSTSDTLNVTALIKRGIPEAARRWFWRSNRSCISGEGRLRPCDTYSPTQPAEALYREARRDLRAMLRPDHPNLGLLDINLGKALWNEHRYAQAETTVLLFAVRDRINR